MKRVEILLTGGYSAYGALDEFIASFAESEGYSNLFVENLQLAMQEAFVNAVKHGNKERDDLTVSCVFTVMGEMLMVTVRDSGTGFNPDELPDPVDHMNLLRLSGRGVYIMRSVAEAITHEREPDGFILTMRYCPY